MFLFKLFFFPAIVQIWNAAPQRPNTIVIFADDIGFSDIGGFGSDIETPKWLRIVLPLFDGHPLRPHRGHLHGLNFCDRSPNSRKGCDYSATFIRYANRSLSSSSLIPVSKAGGMRETGDASSFSMSARESRVSCPARSCNVTVWGV